MDVTGKENGDSIDLIIETFHVPRADWHSFHYERDPTLEDIRSRVTRETEQGGPTCLPRVIPFGADGKLRGQGGVRGWAGGIMYTMAIGVREGGKWEVGRSYRINSKSIESTRHVDFSQAQLIKFSCCLYMYFSFYFNEFLFNEVSVYEK